MIPSPRSATRRRRAAACILASWGLLGGCRASAGHAGDSGATAPLVEVETVGETAAATRRRYSGYIKAWDHYAVGFLVGGRITSILVSEGERVLEGQLIATLAAQDYALVEQLAAIQRDTLEPNVERIESLVKQNILPQSQLDEIKGKYEAALTQQRQAVRQLEYTRLRAPADGVVMERSASVGQIVGSGTPVVILLQLDRMKAELGVTQRDLAYFDTGTRVQVDVPGLESPRTGSIHSVGIVPDPMTHTYTVAVALANDDGALRPGMLCHVEMITDEVRGIFVPLFSVKRNNAGDKVVLVFEPEKGRVREQAVSLGALYEERVRVTDGLAAGAKVVVRGQELLKDGDKVRVQ